MDHEGQVYIVVDVEVEGYTTPLSQGPLSLEAALAFRHQLISDYATEYDYKMDQADQYREGTIVFQVLPHGAPVVAPPSSRANVATEIGYGGWEPACVVFRNLILRATAEIKFEITAFVSSPTELQYLPEAVQGGVYFLKEIANRLDGTFYGESITPFGS